MKIVKEFSRFADEYNRHNIIQSEVAVMLTSMLNKQHYTKMLDLGSGSGAVYNSLEKKQIIVKKFIALDFSDEMLNHHPSASNIQKKCLDFNQFSFFKDYNSNEFDVVISASALQWSSNLSLLLHSISHLASEYYFAFFTSNTFATLHQCSGAKSPIYSKEEIIDALKSTGYKFESIVKSYRLEFISVREMFRYIKQSGVSGGTGQLTYQQMKKLMREYPLDYLEFEVLFIQATH